MRYCGREFSQEEIQWFRKVLRDNPQISRYRLSFQFCETFQWLKSDGKPKAMSCRVAMLRMEREGLFSLPPARSGHFHKVRGKSRTAEGEPKPEQSFKAGDVTIALHVVTKSESALWNEYIDRYHYLGYTPLLGAQMRYFVKAREQIHALIGFGAASWKTAPRDHYIGWNAEQRQRNLHLVINNARFLVLPWVHSKNLCSRILAAVRYQIADDWEARYGYSPVLLETFVEKERFQGTCYKASNWICVGQTKGRGKLDRYNKSALPIKTVWVYPLLKSFRRALCR